MTNQEIKDWQNGDPTPKNFAIKCSGCSKCDKENHIPINMIRVFEVKA